jgi:oligopeptide/dipeptide ABC transporter ATP-binding protein
MTGRPEIRVKQPGLRVRDLHVQYRGRGGSRIHAVNGVTLEVGPAECVGLVGESGCGKSSLGRAVVRLTPACGGSIEYGGRDVLSLKGDALQGYRGRVQMVFQDATGALNPRLTIGQTLGEVLKVHAVAASVSVESLLARVELPEACRALYPHELSGGQRQRVGLARALAVDPDVVIADEPVSALDVSVQAQILALMRTLQRESGLACLFIAHDLAVVRYLCDRVYILYLGCVMESGPADVVLRDPHHPYTRLLIASVPDIDRGLAQRGQPADAVPETDRRRYDPADSGCVFRERCPHRMPVCDQSVPVLREEDGTRACACHLMDR